MAERTPANAAARTARRAKIARALIEEKSPTKIAAELGVTRRTVYTEIAAPETQELIRSWMQPHHAAIKRMIPRALAAVHKGLKPSQETRDRLQAVKTLGTVMSWAEGRATDGDGSSRANKLSGTMEQWLAVYCEITRGGAADGGEPPKAPAA